MLQHSVTAVICPDDESGYVAECPQVHAVTEGEALDEVFANIREAVAVATHGIDLAELGLAAPLTIVVTLTTEPAVA